MTLVRPDPASGRATTCLAERHRLLRMLPLGLAVATVLAQVGYPLVDGDARRMLTIVTVLLFAAASTTHAWVWLGARAVGALLLGVGLLSLVAEAVGVATGYPFGAYAYSGTLGPQPLGVPVVVALAWTMMAYPTLLAARAVCRRRRALTVPVAALGLVGWDLYLDPQMVAEGHWVWQHPQPHLPGMDGIPLTNLAGWVLVSLVVQAVLHRLLPRTGLTADTDDTTGRRLDVRAPALLLGWTWLGSALAHGVFWNRPAVAVWGLVAMAPLVAPALWVWWHEGLWRHDGHRRRERRVR